MDFRFSVFFFFQDLRDQQREEDPEEQGVDAQPLYGQAQGPLPAGFFSPFFFPKKNAQPLYGQAQGPLPAGLYMYVYISERDLYIS
jgi:hypothetical protein